LILCTVLLCLGLASSLYVVIKAAVYYRVGCAQEASILYGVGICPKCGEEFEDGDYLSIKDLTEGRFNPEDEEGEG
jgi:hypothetical protein